MKAFLDLTTVNNGRHEEVLEAFRQWWVAKRGIPEIIATSEINVIHPESISLSLDQEASTLLSGPDASAVQARLHEALKEFLSGAKEHEVVVASFDSELKTLSLEANCSSEWACHVDFVDLRTVLRPTTTINAWPTEIISVDEAMNALTKALADEGGATRQTALRPLLAHQDARLAKQRNGTRVIDQPKFISFLVDKGVEEGLVVRDGEHALIEVTLTEHGRRRVNQFAQQNGSNTLENQKNSEVPLQDYDRESSRYLDVLRKNSLGPFQEVRWAIYEIVDELAEKFSGEITVGELLDQAVSRVRKQVEEAAAEGHSYLISTERTLPWGKVRGFVGMLFIQEPIFVTQTGTVAANWLSLDKVVISMEKDWRANLDSLLIHKLLESGIQLNAMSEADLSGALYNTRTDLRKVRETLRHMLASDKCRYADDFSLILNS